MVCELERVLLECDGFFSSMSATYNGEVQLWQWFHKQAILQMLLTLTGSQ